MATLKGRVLLGWMARDDAIRFLLDDCAFDSPLDVAAAGALWQTYRDRVAALPDRSFAVASHQGITIPEAGHAAKFMAFIHAHGQSQEISGVRKVDLRSLVIRQYYVVTERAEQYAAGIGAPMQWLDLTLPTVPRGSSIQYNFQQQGLNTLSAIDVPHPEFIFTPILAPTPQAIWVPAEALSHVTITDAPDRTCLWAGYHRSFAKLLTTPAANAPTVVAAVTRNVLIPPANPVAPPVATGTGVDVFGPFGAKAALFGDFLSDGLFMDVNLRKKRYQLQVHANMVALDDPT